MQTRLLTIIAQDPTVRSGGRIVRARVEIPAEPVAAGPTGYRVQVIDYDASSNTLYRPLRLGAGDPFARASDRRLIADPRFHAQNAYSIVMRTLSRFELALGRRVSWSFRGHQLKIAPHAFGGANAFYSKRDRALLFGYFPAARGGTVFTCLSHHVVAHETTHALLDGLRERYTDPSSPDQAAFHEGFADVVALLSVFSLKGATNLPDMARQVGSELSGVRNQPLRRPAELKPSCRYMKRREFDRPHRRGELLVAAMIHAFVRIRASRL